MTPPTFTEAEASLQTDESEGGMTAEKHNAIWNDIFAATRGSNKCLSEKTAEKWFEEVVSQKDPEGHYKSVIAPKIEGLLKTREAYDEITQELGDFPESKSFKRLSPEAFWKLIPAERKVYLKEAGNFIDRQIKLKKRVEKIRGSLFQQFVKVTHDELGASSTRDIETLKQGLKHVPLEDADVAGWESFLEKGVQSANQLYNRLKSTLKSERDKGVIGEHIVEEREKMFKNTNIDYKVKEQYIEKTLQKERIGEWRHNKMEWQGVVDLLDPQEVLATNPQVAYALNENNFLEMRWPERQEIVLALKAHLMSQEELSPARKIAYMKKNIQTAVDSKNWSWAMEEISRCRSLAPNDQWLREMNVYIQSQQDAPESIEQDDPFKINQEIQDLHRQISGLAHEMYADAMERGLDEASAIFTGMYNLVWVQEHGYTTAQKSREQAESKFNKEKTQEYIEDGHSRRLEHNILDGDTAHHSAIRDDCKKAQMLHISDKEGAAVTVDKFSEHKNDHLFTYWSTIHLTDLSYERHREIVRNINFPMKERLKKLHALGYSFTRSGAPRKVGGGAPSPTKTVAQQAKPSAPVDTSAKNVLAS